VRLRTDVCGGERMTRFALQWLLPDQCERLTHVILLDRERPAPYVLAVGHGVDNAKALLNLWRTLNKKGAVSEAIDYVTVEYTRRTDKAPGELIP
jgi:hypothetical protein